MKNEEKKKNELIKKPILTETEIKKKKSKKTKTVVAAFILVLGIGVMGNWYIQNSDLSQNVKPLINNSGVKTLGEAEFVDAKTEVTTKKESSYFSKARVDRQSSRDEAIDLLKETINNSQNEEEKLKAEEKLARMSDLITIENKIETLVTAKGVDNCIAVTNTEGTRVDIIVECDELNDSLIMQIKEIAMEQLGCEFKNISIVQSD